MADERDQIIKGVPKMETKQKKLEEYLTSLGRVVIAFSGGVDSTLLAMAAYRALGENAIAATAVSPSLTAKEKEDCAAIDKHIGIKHVFLESGEMADADFLRNDARRCYYCKRVRMGQLCAWAKANGFEHVAEGTNLDDVKDYRPGAQALAELPMIVSPLEKAGLTKADIRAISKEWGLPTWNKQSAACLASRIAYGIDLTPERFRQVEESEIIVRKYVQGQMRVRHHGEVARIEVEQSEFPILMQDNVREEIAARLKKLGFRYVTIDLTGYRMGSLNESLPQK